MSGNDESSSDEERSLEVDEEYFYDESESSEGKAPSAVDIRLFTAVDGNYAAAAEVVQLSIRGGANVNAVRLDTTPLMLACGHGNDRIVDILLDAGADARWKDSLESSAITIACYRGHLFTVQLLINHDNGLLEIADDYGATPLIIAIDQQHPDIVRFLLESGADPHRADRYGVTALMYACVRGSLEVARLLLAAGVDVETRDKWQQTALHYAARRDHIEVVRKLILQHNANMFAVDEDGRTPFDEAWGDSAGILLEMYGDKLTHVHGQFALHELLKVAEYSFVEDEEFFHPPLNPLQIILPLGNLNTDHFLALLYTLGHELIRTRDDTGKLPIHIACLKNAPMEVLALILELDLTTLHIADCTGALPIHLLVCGTAASAATEYASVRYLVEQGGVATLAARDHQGALPLHNYLCGCITTNSNNPSLRTVQYLIQSFPGSVAMRTNAGEYPFLMAAAAAATSDSAWTPLMTSVVYELVRANPGLLLLTAK